MVDDRIVLKNRIVPKGVIDMRQRTLQQVLQAVYRAPHSMPSAAKPSAALEADIMAAYDKRHGHQRQGLSVWRALWQPRSVLARTAATAVLLIALLGVACELPTTANVDMGQRMVLQVQADPSAADLLHFEEKLHGALSAAGADNVQIAIERSNAQTLTFDIVAWDEDLSARRVEEIVRKQLGATNILTVNISTLTGTVTESLGHRMMREFFGADINGPSAEELRADILQRLVEQGFDSAASVQVQDDGTTRKITVEAKTADGTKEVADEIIIERDNN
jgi:hypothetical protein